MSLNTRARTFRQHICHLLARVKIANTDSWIQRNSCAKPVQIDAELSGDMSQIWDVSFNDHLKSCIVVFKKKQMIMTGPC